MGQITLTTNEWFVLKSIKAGQVSFFDGGFNAGSGTYGMCLAPELAGQTDVTARGWGGVIASLVRKGLMETAVVEGNETWLTLTQLAIDVWNENRPAPMPDAYFVYGSGWDKDGLWKSDWVKQDVHVTEYETADEPVRTIEVKSAYKSMYFALKEILFLLDTWPDHSFTVFTADPKFATEDMNCVAIVQADRFTIKERLLENAAKKREVA